MTPRCRRACSGFSLIEVMVVSILLVVVMSGVYATLRTGRNATQIVDRRGEMTQTARALIDQIAGELSSIYIEPEEAESASGTGTEATGGSPPAGTEAEAAAAGAGAAGAMAAGGDDFAAPDTSGEDEASAEEEEKPPPLMGTNGQPGLEEADEIEFDTVAGPRRRGTQPPTAIVRVRYYLDLDDATPEQGLMRFENRYLDLVEDATSSGITEQLSPLVRSLSFRYYDSTNEEWTDEWEEETAPVSVEVTLSVADARGVEDPVIVSAVVNLKTVGVKAPGEALAGDESEESTSTTTEEPTGGAPPSDFFPGAGADFMGGMGGGPPAGFFEGAGAGGSGGGAGAPGGAPADFFGGAG